MAQDIPNFRDSFGYDDDCGDILSLFSIPEIRPQNSLVAKDLCLTDPSRLFKPLEKDVITPDRPQHTPTSNETQGRDSQLPEKTLGRIDSNKTLTEPAKVQNSQATDNFVQQTSTAFSQTTSLVRGSPFDTCDPNLAKEPVIVISSPTQNANTKNPTGDTKAQSASLDNETQKPLWQMTEKLDDPKEESRRINAIKARKNRVNRKKETEELKVKISDIIEERDKLMKTVEEERNKHNMERNNLYLKLMKEQKENQILRESLKKVLTPVLQSCPNLNANNFALINDSSNGLKLVPVVQNLLPASTIIGTESVQLGQNLLPNFTTTDKGAVQTGHIPLQISGNTIENIHPKQIVSQNSTAASINAVQSTQNTLHSSTAIGTGVQSAPTVGLMDAVAVQSRQNLMQTPTMIDVRAVQSDKIPLQIPTSVGSRIGQSGQIHLQTSTSIGAGAVQPGHIVSQASKRGVSGIGQSGHNLVASTNSVAMNASGKPEILYYRQGNKVFRFRVQDTVNPGTNTKP